MAQKLSDFKWEKRLLIISNPSNNSEKEVEQLQYLGPLDQDFTERKLLVLKLNDKTYSVLNSRETTIVSDPKSIKRLCLSETEFSVLLIGLDGGIKLRQDQIISREDLFAIIDGMPMRRSELSQKT